MVRCRRMDRWYKGGEAYHVSCSNDCMLKRANATIECDEKELKDVSTSAQE